MGEAERVDPEAPVTWAQARTVWWALVWRLTALALLPGATLGFLQGLFFSFLMGPLIGTMVGKAVGLLTVAALTLPIVRGLLNRDYGDFSVRLVPSDPTSGAGGAP